MLIIGWKKYWQRVANTDPKGFIKIQIITKQRQKDGEGGNAQAQIPVASAKYHSNESDATELSWNFIKRWFGWAFQYQSGMIYRFLIFFDY